MTKLALLSTALLLAGAVHAAEPAAPAQPAQAQPARTAERPKMVCKTITQTGSRLGTRKYCTTRGQWEMKTQEDRKFVEHAAATSAQFTCTVSMTGAC